VVNSYADVSPSPVSELKIITLPKHLSKTLSRLMQIDCCCLDTYYKVFHMHQKPSIQDAITSEVGRIKPETMSILPHLVRFHVAF